MQKIIQGEQWSMWTAATKLGALEMGSVLVVVVVVVVVVAGSLHLHWEKYISISFHSECDMIVVTDFEPNENSIWFKNCYQDHIPFTVKGNGNIVFSV